MLMEGVMHYGYKGKELSEVSKCRLYLWCTTLADITNGKGGKLLTAAIYCHQSALTGRRQCEWPTQPAPNQSQQYYGEKQCTNASLSIGGLLFGDNHWEPGMNHPATFSDMTLTTECTTSWWTMATGTQEPITTLTRTLLDNTSKQFRQTTSTEYHERHMPMAKSNHLRQDWYNGRKTRSSAYRQE
jgi:hypothetical protein